MQHILNRIKNKEQFWIAPHHVDELLPLLSRLWYNSGRSFAKQPCSHYNINYWPAHVRGICVISVNGQKRGTQLTPHILNQHILSRRS